MYLATGADNVNRGKVPGGADKAGYGSIMAYTTHRIIMSSLAGLAIAVLLAGCSSDITQRGSLPDPARLAGITPGETTYRDVASTLGSPSTVSTFKNEIWYYIGAHTQKTAFFKPSVLDQQVVVIAFNDDGTVSSIAHYDMDDARDIDPVNRVTPTSGKELSFIQQILGNIGRFASPDAPQ